MSPPWMPLNVADYLRDTTHLDAEESGAYLHLIMGYWVAGGLPNDNRQLAKIAKISSYKWNRIRPTIEAFFRPGFSAHKRIDRELQRAAEIGESRSEKARQAAHKRWNKSMLGAMPKHRPSIAQAMLGDAPTQRKKEDTDREMGLGAVDKCGQLGPKGSTEEAIKRMRSRKT